MNTIRENQQPDGSFSTNYFSRPGTSPEISKRISATGHALEFLMVVLDDDELRRAVGRTGRGEPGRRFREDADSSTWNAARFITRPARWICIARAASGPRPPLVPSESPQPAVTETTAKKSP